MVNAICWLNSDTNQSACQLTNWKLKNDKVRMLASLHVGAEFTV